MIQGPCTPHEVQGSFCIKYILVFCLQETYHMHDAVYYRVAVVNGIVVVVNYTVAAVTIYTAVKQNSSSIVEVTWSVLPDLSL